jgi:thiol:disulfide interchange protein DsbD
MTAYLFGWIRFPHDSPMKKLSIPRAGLAIGMAVLTVYLASGFLFNERTQTYNSLAMLSGLAPPAHYNYFRPIPDADASIKSRFPSFSKCANNLDCFHDYYEGVAYAKEVQKPVFLDFTGYGCVNCRKTEEHIWVDDRVWNRLKNDFVMISLYGDDREPLEPVLVSKSTQKKLRTVGLKWSDFQIVNFGQNSQPLYVIMTPDGEVLTKPRGYHEGVKGYVDFLECGLQVYEESGTLLGDN